MIRVIRVLEKVMMMSVLITSGVIHSLSISSKNKTPYLQLQCAAVRSAVHTQVAVQCLDSVNGGMHDMSTDLQVHAILNAKV